MVLRHADPTRVSNDGRRVGGAGGCTIFKQLRQIHRKCEMNIKGSGSCSQHMIVLLSFDHYVLSLVPCPSLDRLKANRDTM